MPFCIIFIRFLISFSDYFGNITLLSSALKNSGGVTPKQSNPDFENADF